MYTVVQRPTSWSWASLRCTSSKRISRAPTVRSIGLTIVAAFVHQIQSTKDAGPIAYLNGLRNLTIVAAFVHQIQSTKDAGPIAYLNGLRNLTIVTAFVYQIQKTKDKGPFKKYHVLLNDESQAVKNQSPQNHTMEDEESLDKLYLLRTPNDPTYVAIICWLEKVMATESDDATQAGSECSFKVSDPCAILRLCSSLFVTVGRVLEKCRAITKSRIHTLFFFSSASEHLSFLQVVIAPLARCAGLRQFQQTLFC